MSLNQTIKPATEPLSLSGVKQHLVVEHSEDDALLYGLIQAERQRAESYTGRAFISQTWEVSLPCFQLEIELPRPPLQSVTSVKYIDTDGAEQTVSSSDYEVDTAGFVGKVRPVSGASWPSTGEVYNAVTIAYVAGYGDAGSDVPDPIRHGMLININDLYEQRGAQIVGAIEKNTEAGNYLIGLYRVHTL